MLGREGHVGGTAADNRHRLSLCQLGLMLLFQFTCNFFLHPLHLAAASSFDIGQLLKRGTQDSSR
jgi:hypothetical protein